MAEKQGTQVLSMPKGWGVFRKNSSEERVSMLSSKCVPESIENAKNWTTQTGQPVKIAISNISPGKDHAQAVAFDSGKMIPLTAHNFDAVLNRMKPEPWDWHYPDKKPYRFVEVDDFMKEQEKNLDPDFLQYLKGIK